MSRNNTGLPRAVELSHEWLADRIAEGDTVVDATVGNGHDTVFLAEQVGRSGQVFGFDIQAEAIASTKERLDSKSLEQRVTLFHACHGSMGARIPEAIDGAIFNLGYLPGSEVRSVITRPETTRAALEVLAPRLREGGRIVIVVYPGHPGGEEEAEEVMSWAQGLDQTKYTAVCYRTLNRPNSPPFLVAVEKR